MSSGRQNDEQPTSRGRPQDQHPGHPEMVILLPGIPVTINRYKGISPFGHYSGLW